MPKVEQKSDGGGCSYLALHRIPVRVADLSAAVISLTPGHRHFLVLAGPSPKPHLVPLLAFSRLCTFLSFKQGRRVLLSKKKMVVRLVVDLVPVMSSLLMFLQRLSLHWLVFCV